MEAYCIFFIASLSSCVCEWILLPSIYPTQNKLNGFQSEPLEPQAKNFSTGSPEFCPDFHNLTTMSYGTLFQEDTKSRAGWEISLADVEEILRENEKLPKSSKEKANLLKQMEYNMMSEAEERLKALFSPSREARTKNFHYPSMESALLTISMLLFGVYLSKLILKLLVSHYNRYNGGMAMMTGMRAPITIAHGRKRRSTELQKIHLMHLVDKYSSRFN